MANKKKRSARDDELELDHAYEELTGYKISAKKKGGIGPVLMGIVIFALLLGSCAFALPYLLSEPTEPQGSMPATSAPAVTESTAASTTEQTDPAQRTADGLWAAGQELGNMTYEEVRAALNQAYAQTEMIVTINGADYTLPALSPDLDGAAAAMMTFSGTDFDMTSYLIPDTAQLRSQLDTLTAQACGTVSQTGYTIEGEMPSLDPWAQDVQCQTLVITVGTPGITVDSNALLQQVLDAYNGAVFTVTAECTATDPGEFDLAAVYDATYIAPTDAIMDMSTFTISGGTYGYEFDLAQAQSLLAQAGPGEELRISFTRTEPAVTAASLSALLFRDVLASHSTSYTNNANRTNNLYLACESIDGLLLFPGEVFSYNAALGERTAEKGYLSAGTIEAGGVVDSLGGGICQVSSTLYYCTLVADLEIVEHYNHGYPVGYVPLGMDATVSWGSLDFKFRNNTRYPLRIEAWLEDGQVHIQLVGTDEKDYYIELEYEIIAEYPYDTVYREMSASNAEGYRDGDVITTGSTGYDVYTYQRKYSKETGELLAREYADISDYWKRDLVIVKIVD